MTANDKDRFWAANMISEEQNCFNPEAAQVAMGIRMNEECVYAELNEEGDPWNFLSLPIERRCELNKRYNDRAVRIVGIPLLPEEFDPPDAQFPYVKRIGEVFGGVYQIGYQTGEWLSHPSLKSEEELGRQLDAVDTLLADDFRLLRQFIYPDNWEAEKRRIYDSYGKRPPVLRRLRGPVTLASSLYGVDLLSYLAMDNPDLFVRFGDTIRAVILAMAAISDEEAGYGADDSPRGFFFADDDCAFFTPDMYRRFGYPVLRDVFARYAPDEQDTRYQHSDSPMAHLLPQLGSLQLNGCNFGPTVLVPEIRASLPDARIDGCLAPFTFMENDTEKIRAEVRRDCQDIKGTGTRGLSIYTAGSINNGSSLESMLTVMESVMEYGQY